MGPEEHIYTNAHQKYKNSCCACELWRCVCVPSVWCNYSTRHECCVFNSHQMCHDSFMRVSGEGRASLVLGAGNQTFLGIVDLLDTLFLQVHISMNVFSKCTRLEMCFSGVHVIRRFWASSISLIPSFSRYISLQMCCQGVHV